MTQSRYYQWSLSFPILLWGVALIVFPLLYRQGDSAIVNHVFQGYRVFIPYLIFAAGLWKFARNRSYKTLILLAFIVPIIWGFFFTVFYITASLISSGKVSDETHILCIMTFWAMFVAYLCEIIPLCILIIFKNDFSAAPDRDMPHVSSETAPQ